MKRSRPIRLIAGAAAVPVTALIGSSSRSDGMPQLTYKGHPLYLFSGDQSPATSLNETS
jgi:hypothetical protein